MRISDWSSDVCSSDLLPVGRAVRGEVRAQHEGLRAVAPVLVGRAGLRIGQVERHAGACVQCGEVFRQAARVLPVQADGRFNRAQVVDAVFVDAQLARSEEHTSELQSLMRISYAFFCLKKKN